VAAFREMRLGLEAPMSAWVSIALLLAALLTSALTAQEVTGRIEGRVLGANGSPLPEVEVTASSPSLLGTRVVITDQAGRFQLEALPVGAYRVVARRIGYRAVVVEDVSVRLGETASLPRISLTQAAVQLAEITVSGEAVGLDPSSTASSLRLSARQLDEIPVSRDFRQIALLTPTSVPSYLGRAGGVPDGINIGGATGIENAYYLDGINITDVFHGGAGLSLPYNFIEQIEIRTGGSTAEDAQALGGVVNVVTPTLGERLQGSVFAFYSADELSTNSKALLGSTETGFAYYDVGARAGGPILPRRLSFFAAYDRTSGKSDHTLPFGTATNTDVQHLFAGKLTWRAGPHTSAAFTIIGDPSRGEGLGGSLFGSGVPTEPEGLRRKGSGGGVGVSLRAIHFVRSNLVVEGSLAEISRDGETGPATAAGHGPIVIDQVAGTLSGGVGGVSSDHSRRRSAGLGVSWKLGLHNLRTGALYERLYLESRFDASRPNGGTITRASPVLWYWHTNRSERGAGENRMPSIFVQDAWQISRRLLLSAGLRWSRQTVHNLTSDTVNFQIKDGLQPRLGVVFQPGRIGTQRVYASYGRVANQFTLRGVDELNGFGAETLFVFPQDPRVDTAGSSIDYTAAQVGGFSGDGTLRGETGDEYALGYDRKVTSGLTLSVRAVRRVHRDAVQFGIDTLGVRLMGNPGRGALAHFPRPRRTYHALELTVERPAEGRSPWFRVSYVLSRTRGNYTGLYGSDWSLDFGHVGPLYFTPEQHENGTGLLPNDRPHVLKGFGAQRIGSHLSLGASVLLASGTPLSEYGAVSGFGPPFRKLVRQRGTGGRTPTIWDLGLRAAFELPSPVRSGIRTRVLLDLEHIGSPRNRVDHDQVHYTCIDEQGQQSCPNAGYRRVIQYQPPMRASIGIEAGF
jgi:hypothetical protein